MIAGRMNLAWPTLVGGYGVFVYRNGLCLVCAACVYWYNAQWTRVRLREMLT
jgi:hypothetical protein